MHYQQLASNCASAAPSPLVSGALAMQLDYLHEQIPESAFMSSSEIAASRRKNNRRVVSIIGARMLGTGLDVHGRHLQQTSLTNYDHFYSLGAFFLALSYSMGRIFSYRNPRDLDCGGRDARRIVSNFAHLKCHDNGLTDRIHEYEATKMKFKICTELDCMIHVSSGSPRKLKLATGALTRGMQSVRAIQRYSF